MPTSDFASTDTPTRTAGKRGVHARTTDKAANTTSQNVRQTWSRHRALINHEHLFATVKEMYDKPWHVDIDGCQGAPRLEYWTPVHPDGILRRTAEGDWVGPSDTQAASVDELAKLIP